MKHLPRLLLPLAYMAVIYLLSSIPDTGAPRNLAEKVLQWATPELQNLLHIPLFGGLAATWYWALSPLLPSRYWTLLLSFLISTGYAFFDEWHQLHVPGRYGSLTDIALDTLGAGLSMVILLGTLPKVSPRDWKIRVR